MRKFIYLLAVAFVSIAFTSCTIVDSGEVGIEFHKWSSDSQDYGGVEGTCKGWVFYNPFTTSVFTYPTYTQRKQYETINVNAKDASLFEMDPTIAYHINPDKACDIFGADWWGIPIDEYADMRFVTHLPKASVAMQVNKVEGGYDVILENKSQVIAYQNILKALDQDGQLIPGSFWSDNFVTVLPGETLTLHCNLPAGCGNATIGFSGWNAKLDK